MGRRLAEGVSFSVLQIKSCHRVGGSRNGADGEEVMRRYVGNKAVPGRRVEAEMAEWRLNTEHWKIRRQC